jgi:hypothetical protein
MNVGIFYNTITNPNKFSNKLNLMNLFAAGVRTQGDTAIEFRTPILPDQRIDAGFVLGYTLEKNFRRRVIDYLQSTATPAVFVDSNILHYARPEHEWHRYSVNSVYPDTGTYFFQPMDTTKWARYSAWHGVELQPWRTQGRHIVIFCQRPQGWNLQGQDQQAWIDNTIHILRQHTDRPIMVRMHPGDSQRYSAMSMIQQRHGRNIEFSTHNNIRDALSGAWAAVGYNSTPNVVAAIEGVPVYVEDPPRSWAQDVAFSSLSQIENPTLPDRTEWINKIANIHWSNQEVQSGLLWSAIKQHICSVR